jgi:riboflavin synthase
MFSGIVESMGIVAERRDGPAVTRFVVRAPEVLGDVAIGDSICVEGVCLTVVEHDGEHFHVEAIPETLRLTTLGDIGAGDGVNLERSLSLQTRLGGHLVFGHVDGVGERLAGPPSGFQATPRDEEEVVHWYTIPSGLERYLTRKGSITVLGVSLTVVDVAEGAFSVALIPHTLEVTTLGSLPVGGRVNLEADMIAKYVADQLAPYIERLEGLTAGGGTS